MLGAVLKPVAVPVLAKEKEEVCLTAVVGWVLVCPNLNALLGSPGPLWNGFIGVAKLVDWAFVLLTPNLNACDDEPLVPSLACCCPCGKSGLIHGLFVPEAPFDVTPDRATAGSPNGLASLRWKGDGGTVLVAALLAAAAAPLNEKPTAGLGSSLAWSPSAARLIAAGAKGFDLRPLAVSAKGFGCSDGTEVAKAGAAALATDCGPRRSSKLLLPDVAEDEVSAGTGVGAKGGGLGNSLAAGVGEDCEAAAVLDGNATNAGFEVSAGGVVVVNLKGLGDTSLDSSEDFGVKNEVMFEGSVGAAVEVEPNLKPVILTVELKKTMLI